MRSQSFGSASNAHGAVMGQAVAQRKDRSTLAVMTGADCIHLHAPPELTLEEIELMGDLLLELRSSFPLGFTCHSILVGSSCMHLD